MREGELSLLAYPIDRDGYGRLSTLLSRGKMRADKGECELIGDFAADYVGTILMQIVMGDMEPEAAKRASNAVLGASHDGQSVELFLEESIGFRVLSPEAAMAFRHMD